MIFKYDVNRLKDYRKNGIFRGLSLFCIAALVIIMSPIMFFTIYSIELDQFTIIMSIILPVFFFGIAIIIGIAIGYKKAKKEFESYQIACNDERIVIISIMQHKEINLNQITKLFLNQLRFKHKIIGLFAYGYILYSVTRGVYNAIIYF